MAAGEGVAFDGPRGNAQRWAPRPGELKGMECAEFICWQ